MGTSGTPKPIRKGTLMTKTALFILPGLLLLGLSADPASVDAGGKPATYTMKVTVKGMT